MAHILTLREFDPTQGQPDTRILLAMFEARKSVFVDLLKWNVPVLDGRYELDQFDDDRARYVVLADDAGMHHGSARLLPTTREHILGDLYAHLCEGEVPRGADIFEITRFCLDRRLRTTARRQVRDALVRALVDQALASGIRTYTAIAGTAWFRQIEQFGWECRPLGAPCRVAGEELRAMRIEIDATTPALLAARGIGTGAAGEIHAEAGIRPAARESVTPALERVA